MIASITRALARHSRLHRIKANCLTISAELTDRFGGVTAYSRTPATGLWEARSGETVRDDVVVYEVMTDDLEATWWAAMRKRLEAAFAQDELVVRAHKIERL